MNFSFLTIITIIFLTAGCTHKTTAPEVNESNTFTKASSEKNEVKDVTTPKQKAKQQLAKEIRQNEKRCDMGEMQVCWKLVTTYLNTANDKSFYSLEKAEAAFQKLCKQENITCFKNYVKIKEAKNPDSPKETGSTFMYSDQGKYKSYSYKEYSN